MVSTAINQHLVLPNSLINASYALTKVDVRFIIALLVRIRRRGLEFEELCVPIQEVLAPSRRQLSGKDYNAGLVALQARLTNIRLRFEPPSRSVSELVTTGLPLLAHLQYEKQKGWLRVRLSDALRPFFEQSDAAYTSASYTQISKLISPLAHRLYWLLCESADSGTRTLELAHLAWLLNLPSPRFNFSLFCARELRAAQQQLAATDLACTFALEYTRQKSRLHAVHFQFIPSQSARPTSLVAVSEPQPNLLDWLVPEGENTLLHGLLILFRFILGGTFIATAVTCGSN